MPIEQGPEPPSDISHKVNTHLLIRIDNRGNSMGFNNCPERTLLTRAGPNDNFREFSPLEMYEALSRIVASDNLGGNVEVRTVGCIWGCTYGPRMDVIIRSEGEEPVTVLYGNEDYQGPITLNPDATIIGIPDLDSLRNIIYDNLYR